MNERSDWIDRLQKDIDFRIAYTKAKLSVNIPSQIKAMRRRRDNMSQKSLAHEAGKKQSQISAMERPGASSYTVETLVRLAAAFRVGLIIKFAPFSEMLQWENSYSQDTFNATPLEEDKEFTNPEPTVDILHNAYKTKYQMTYEQTKQQGYLPFSSATSDEKVCCLPQQSTHVIWLRVVDAKKQTALNAAIGGR